MAGTPPSVAAVVRDFCVDAREGRIPDGTHVRQRDLMSLHGATRATAQSAIAIIRHQGLLVPDFRGRLRLRLPRRSELREIYALRIALEQLILQVMLEREHEVDLNQTRVFFASLSSAIAEGRWDVDRAESLAFNRLARASGWPMLVRMVGDLQHDLRPTRLLLDDLMQAPTTARTSANLGGMWQAVANRDVATACGILRTHIEEWEAWVLERLPETTAA